MESSIGISGAVGAGWGRWGRGSALPPGSSVFAMSRRQRERPSCFQDAIETGVRSAGLDFGDNDVEASVASAVRLWWTSRLRGRRFAQLVQQAREVTRQRISLGIVQRGEPGRRKAMPYFFAVLRNLANQERSAARHLSVAGKVE